MYPNSLIKNIETPNKYVKIYKYSKTGDGIYVYVLFSYSFFNRCILGSVYGIKIKKNKIC